MGIIKHEYYVTIAASLLVNYETDYINKRIERILSILPKGAQFVGQNDGILYSSRLAILFVLEFSHPAFEDGTKIELEELTIRWVDDKDSSMLHQDSILTNIKFLSSENKQLFMGV